MSEEWIERWQQGRTGWHQPDGNSSLKKHWKETGRRVLVPLCGKSPDLRWLADHGNDVIGVEVSELAVGAFFDEQGLEYEVHEGELPAYQATSASIRIYCGDFFELTSVRCDAHYDRGALIAMPPELRASYAAHTRSLLEDGASQLLITLEYDQTRVPGPPFSVEASEVLSYWPDFVTIDTDDVLERAPQKFRDGGLTELTQVVWRSPQMVGA